MNQDSQKDEKPQGPIIRVRARRIKGKDDQIAQGLMTAIEETMKEGLKFKNKGLEDDGNPPKLLIVQCLNLKQWSKLEEKEFKQSGRPYTYHPQYVSVHYGLEQGLLYKRLIRGWVISPSVELAYCYKSHKRGFIMSTDTQFLTPHNEGTSKSPHSNLDPMRVIMQELQSMRSKMGDMQRDITNLSIEQRGNYNHHGSFGTLVETTHQFYDGGRHTTPRSGRRGSLGRRGYRRPQEDIPRHEA
ncbi:hypothetical protein M9H77_23272 [Catharanthus roseus]|uniref:Uncharacterized protein n=1 Tax=Catharanthus roseus TaxID=4058 RepID=A0ACC0ATS3_CATRO|nr:hypothetical protein M9H77_23272 [Catharanthus roseus]